MPPTTLILRHAVAALGLLAPAALQAQRDTVVVAGGQYARGAAYRAMFGSDYRRLWTTPTAVPVLDLRTYAGGLRPVSARLPGQGGFQTKSLWFIGADGLPYGFRSLDKWLAVPEEIDSTFIAAIARDLTSAQHPGAILIAPALLEAAGVLHTDPALAFIPDEPLLGDTYRANFAGTLGVIERRANTDAGFPPFAGAREIVSTRRLLPRLFAGPADRVDAHAYLTARLMDVFMGDWDRHRGQWQWARLADGSPAAWRPIPEDRDHAFVRFGGAMLAVGRATAAPQLVDFGAASASTLGQTWNGRDIDRWFLSGLERDAWDSTALWLQGRLGDSVIAAAVARMPAAWHALDGDRLERALRSRRDHLPEAAARFYEQLAHGAEVHATRAAEAVTIERLDDGRLSLRLAARDTPGAPYLSRTFLPGETRELRLYLYGGGDRVVVRGAGAGAIGIRLIGGGTALPDSALPAAGVTVFDSSRAGGVRLYARDSDSVAAGPVAVDRRAWSPGASRSDAPPPRDWGRRRQPTLWVGFGPDVGLFAGWGEIRTGYGFRKLPYASRWRLRAGWATTANTARIGVDGVVFRQNSGVHAEVSGLVSGIEVLRWYGRGNATAESGSRTYNRVTQHRYAARAALVLPSFGRATLSVGPVVSFNDTRLQAGRIMADSVPYGANDFGEAGLRAEWALDTRDMAIAARHGVTLTLGGSAYPAVWDVVRAFGEAHGEATLHLTADSTALRPTLALRAGGKRVFGTYPFHEAAFIGDAATVRLGRQNRYAGDAAAYGNAELRLRLGRAFILLPGEIGIMGLADAGRVWVEGESSDTWHTAFGGGVWWSFVRPSNVLSLYVASGREHVALYLGAGFAY